MLTEEELQQLKDQLISRQREIEDQLMGNQQFGLTHEMVKESMGELANYDNHPADHGTEEFERAKDVTLNQHLEEEREGISRALAAMEKGEYGRCEVCGAEIPFRRLEAVPTARRCLIHA